MAATARLACGLLLVLASGAPGPARAAPPVRAHYEVTLEHGRSHWSVGSAADVLAGQAITHELGPYRLVLTPAFAPAGRYTLTVAVGAIPRASGALYVPDRRTFAGTLGYPLEFETRLDGVTVKGAIMVAPARP